MPNEIAGMIVYNEIVFASVFIPIPRSIASKFVKKERKKQIRSLNFGIDFVMLSPNKIAKLILYATSPNTILSAVMVVYEVRCFLLRRICHANFPLRSSIIQFNRLMQILEKRVHNWSADYGGHCIHVRIHSPKRLREHRQQQMPDGEHGLLQFRRSQQISTDTWRTCENINDDVISQLIIDANTPKSVFSVSVYGSHQRISVLRAESMLFNAAEQMFSNGIDQDRVRSSSFIVLVVPFMYWHARQPPLSSLKKVLSIIIKKTLTKFDPRRLSAKIQ